MVSDRVAAQAAQLSAVRRTGYTADGRLRHKWIVRVPPGTAVSRVLPGVPGFLAELEQADVTDLECDLDRDAASGISEQLRRLHLSSCAAYPPEEGRPPGFYVYPEASETWVGDGEDIRLFCEEFLRAPAQADVLAKLAASGADERHAVVIATGDQLGLYTAVDMGLTPRHVPDIDQCIDRLWVIALGSQPARGCYWTRQRGWAAAALVS